MVMDLTNTRGIYANLSQKQSASQTDMIYKKMSIHKFSLIVN